MVKKSKRKFIRYKKGHVTWNHENAKRRIINLLYTKGYKLLYNFNGEFHIGKALNYHDLEKSYRIDIVMYNEKNKRFLIIEVDGKYHTEGVMVKKTQRKEMFIMMRKTEIFPNHQDYVFSYYHIDPKEVDGSNSKDDKYIMEFFHI